MPIPEAAAIPPDGTVPQHLDFSISSETTALERVLVHAPGAEMELVSPDNRLDLLFDDILFVGRAREEHLLMCRLFERVVGRADAALQLSPMLLETFQMEDARHAFVERLCRALPERNLRAVESDLKHLSPEELHFFALTGQSPLPIREEPVPNLMFTRDLAAVVHDHLILSHAATAARSRESLIISAVLHYHPAFAGCRDRILTLPAGVTFEGGDLLVAGPEVVLIGHSERTSFSGVMAVAHALFEHTPVEHVLMVELPKRRSCMHLDTVFTFATPDVCVVFPPLIEEDRYGYAVHFTAGDRPGQFHTDMRPHFKSVLEELLDRPLTFIPCGGTERHHQRREQWTDGANLFAIAPGVVVGYERNGRTFDEMARHGYRVLTAQDFLDAYAEAPAPGEKIAIQLEGNELSRGRGGPRCMTLPLARGTS